MNLKNPLGLAGAIAVIFQMIPSSSWAQKQGEIFRPTTVSYQEDAGAVHVAIIGARHLDEVIGELQPTFEMNEKLALSSSIPVSLSYYNDAVSSFKAS